MKTTNCLFAFPLTLISLSACQIAFHVPHAAITEGFLPAAHKLGLSVVLITDHAQEYRRLLATSDTPAEQLQILECDVFNPLAVVELINAHGLQPVGVFSASNRPLPALTDSNTAPQPRQTKGLRFG
jgi:hypothetical protein